MFYKKMKITVFGAGGFIGSQLMAHLKAQGIRANRGDWRVIDFAGQDLGTVIFCGGVGDCNKVEDVIYSHVDVVRHVVNTAKYDFIIYISSTRLYLGNECSNVDTSLILDQEDKRILFNQAKLLAETIIKSQSLPFAIIRPSNVYGSAYNSGLFLPTLVRDAVTKKEINLYVAPDYSKDYVHVDDVIYAIIKILHEKHCGTFNVASGENVNASHLVDFLVRRTGCKANWHKAWSNDTFPNIDINPLIQRLGFKPNSVITMLDEMIDVFKDKFNH